VVNGSPVRFVATPEDGVPSNGVTSVGEVLSTTLPAPVTVVVPVPPFATGRVPVTPVVNGSPVLPVSAAATDVAITAVKDAGPFWLATL